MKIYSFTREGLNLVPFEVEVNFMPGLPQIQIMGQPDQIIKESQLRIKSALQKQGFSFPKAKQILVNLKPSYIKKKSQGLDLAIACGYLFASGQVPVPSADKDIYIYGELGLDGHVYMPEDFDLLDDYSDKYLLTGFTAKATSQGYYSLNELKNLNEPDYQQSSDNLKSFIRPETNNIYLSKPMARLLQIITVGEHSTLLAGPAGSGKSTFAELVPSFLKPPNKEQAFDITKFSRMFQKKQNWRPIVMPHHTIPKISMVGGGNYLSPGEITRAHNGVLLLDELLEFSTPVKEALREPIEKGCIHIARRSRYHKFPSDFLLISTTNLCPCGDMSPGKMGRCRFSLRKCQSYIEKLSGPLLDRFQILSFSYEWGGNKEVYAPDLLPEVLEAQSFATEVRGQEKPNAKLNLAEATDALSTKAKSLFELKEFKSQRRRLATLRVSRSIADLAGSTEVEFDHISQAYKYCEGPFKQIQSIFS